jgi:hypothetical protein
MNNTKKNEAAAFVTGGQEVSEQICDRVDGQGRREIYQPVKRETSVCRVYRIQGLGVRCWHCNAGTVRPLWLRLYRLFLYSIIVLPLLVLLPLILLPSVVHHLVVFFLYCFFNVLLHHCTAPSCIASSCTSFCTAL